MPLTPVCKTCKHLMFPQDGPHECPSEAYNKLHDRLVSEAAEVFEFFGSEELDRMERESGQSKREFWDATVERVCKAKSD